MFKKLNRKRLLELAGIEPIQHGPEDRSMSPHHQEPEDHSMGNDDEGGEDSSEESTEKHLGKETEVFHKVHDALEELLDFLQNQEGFEKNRGKGGDYAEMEHVADDLKSIMQKHLSDYDSDKEGEDHDDLGDEDHEPPTSGDGDQEALKMIKNPNKMSFR